MSRLLVWFVLVAVTIPSACPAELTFKQRLLGDLVKKVPGILKTYDPATGHFGKGIWNCRDQQAMYPLAVVYATPGAANRYHLDPKLLEVIMRAGDALIDDMDRWGKWEYRKKDGSTWGRIYMPWTYSRWIRSYGLIRDQMPPERRDRWAKALTLGYSGIATWTLGGVDNISAHHAMGLYAAGKFLQRPEWCRQAADFVMKVVAAQREGGYWAEGGGPVVWYDFVYAEAVGTYYALSGDRRVLPALAKVSEFHRRFTYPNGQVVETLDQRNPLHDEIPSGNVGFTFSPAGRAFLLSQWDHRQWRLDADLMASLVLYGEEGPATQPAPPERDDVFVLKEQGVDRAATIRRGPWFVCLSAYTAPVSTSRWHQDRQNMVSIFHERTGVILGGGNTKLQPAWSNFTVGDAGLLTHKPGDENPNFRPPEGKLFHVASAAKLLAQPPPGLELTCGPETCRISVLIKDQRTLEYRVEATQQSALPTAAHLTLLPHLGEPLQTAAGREATLGSQPLALLPAELGTWLAHAGWRIEVPDGAGLRWPLLPHNPYRKDGRAEPSEGRIVIDVPLDRQHPQRRFLIEVPGGD
jgi:hypothetical protein